jgi:hypothetical protein
MNPILERSACVLCGGYALAILLYNIFLENLFEAESLVLIPASLTCILIGIGGPRALEGDAEDPAPFLFEEESRMPGGTRSQRTGRSAGLRSRLS